MQYRAFWKPLDRAERPLLEWVVRVRRGGRIEQATWLISKLGEHGLVWYLIAALMARLDRRRSDQWLIAALKIAGIYALSTTIKFVARRHRPELSSIGTETALSFPSSHAATSFAAARLYGDLFPTARPLLLAGATGMTSTRLHFCAHYPSDLVAGAAFGDAVARLVSDGDAR